MCRKEGLKEIILLEAELGGLALRHYVHSRHTEGPAAAVEETQC